MQRPQEAWSSLKSMVVLLCSTEGRVDKFDFFFYITSNQPHSSARLLKESLMRESDNTGLQLKSLPWNCRKGFNEEMLFNPFTRPRPEFTKFSALRCVNRRWAGHNMIQNENTFCREILGQRLLMCPIDRADTSHSACDSWKVPGSNLVAEFPDSLSFLFYKVPHM
jgi:hypothetical protein